MRTRLKLAISWLIMALGFLLGLAACVLLGRAPISLSDRTVAWLAAIAVALFGLTFLIGSIVALHNRRLAGIIFLSVMPVAGCCFAYPAYSEWTTESLTILLIWLVPYLPVGLFWLRTGTRGWPALVRTQSWSRRKRVAAVAATCVTVTCLDVALTILLSGLASSLYSGSCSGTPPFLHPLRPTHAVFTARVVFAARSLNLLMDDYEYLRPSGPDRHFGDWAIGIVEERFWGMPRWTRFVLLTNEVYWQGETYFVDGAREEGLVTRFFPVVEGGVSCSRTRPVQEAIVDLRRLRTPPPRGATRVMGSVRGPEIFTPRNVRPRQPAFVAGATIDVTGPSGARRITTDSAGVYELDGLAPGDYTLRLSAPDTQTAGFFDDWGSPAVIHLDNGGVAERNFELFWNGRIEGTVSDDSGAPARVRVELLSADGTQLPGYAHHSEMTAQDGSYQFRKIPPGRYLVVVNPHGPHNEWPHDLQYFPRAVRKENAQVLELAYQGQRLSGINFRTPRLAQRNTQVRVTWADGTAVAGTHVCVAYENTGSYEEPAGGNCVNADHNGVAVIRAHGGSQVRIAAKQYVDRDNHRLSDTVYSQRVQYAADHIPNTVNLVLNFVKP